MSEMDERDQKQQWQDIIDALGNKRRVSPHYDNLIDTGWDAAYQLALIVRKQQDRIERLEYRVRRLVDGDTENP